MRQAHMTAHDYMMQARIDIDSQFGVGYAAEHPELVAAYMQTVALDYGRPFWRSSCLPGWQRSPPQSAKRRWTDQYRYAQEHLPHVPSNSQKQSGPLMQRQSSVLGLRCRA
jgi:hypothetical protein